MDIKTSVRSRLVVLGSKNLMLRVGMERRRFIVCMIEIVEFEPERVWVPS